MKISTLPRQQYKQLLREELLSIDELKAWIKAIGCLVIGVGMLKGGTGKTTATIFIALWIAWKLGLKVCVVDTDDNSQSVVNWLKVREATKDKVPFDHVVYDEKDEDGPELDEVIEHLKESFDVVIVDTGGAGKEAYWEVSREAHLLILPVAPSGIEVIRIPPTIRQAARGSKANENTLRASVVMVKCDGRTSLPAEQRPAVASRIASAMEEVKHGDLVVSMPAEAFEISNSPDYPRFWETMPKPSHTEEWGAFLRHVLKEAVA
ncbi:ParA family protein [Streptomyces sp. NPDC046685]|uniref:ParA family protein n=1 Tax=Streptomyces sp. NPDC046685 TaxID=3157202 RepID=UPI0033DC07A7